MDFQLNAYNMAVSSEVVGDILETLMATTLPLTLQLVD